MTIEVSGQVGPQLVADGTSQPFRQGRSAEMVVQELHGRFYEQNYRNVVFSTGMTALTSIANATFTSATTGATATPIVGVWNPVTSTVNLSILQAILGLTTTAATSTGGGPFVWMVATSQTALTLGITPFNRKSLTATGSQAKGFGGTALTGLNGALSVMCGSALNGGTAGFSQVGTAVGFSPFLPTASVENFDGCLIIPPGGLLALMATTTPVAHSAVSSLVWEEIPL